MISISLYTASFSNYFMGLFCLPDEIINTRAQEPLLLVFCFIPIYADKVLDTLMLLHKYMIID